MTIEHPKVFLQDIDWYNLVGVGQANVGKDGYPPWNWALGLAASLSFTGLSHVVSTFARPEKGWQHVHRTNLDGDAYKRWRAIYTCLQHPNRPVETISAEDDQVTSIFNWLRETHHQPTSSSTGWTGNLTLVLPVLNTICTPAEIPILGSTINVTAPSSRTSGNPTFTIDLGPIPSLDFTGATCLCTFRQASYAVNMWIVDMEGADLSFNSYGHEWHQNIIYEPTIPSDYNIADKLATQIQECLPRMEGLVPATGLLTQFLYMSRMLQSVDAAAQSDSTGLSIVLGVLLQTTLSVGNKYRSPVPPSLPSEPELRVTSHPIQWQLYGSRPRLPWEWMTVAVLVIIVLSFLFGIFQTVWYRMAPGSWMQADGMMMLAQTSPPLDDIEDPKKAREKIYWVARKTFGGIELKSKAG
jgi:hypothetical protein